MKLIQLILEGVTYSKPNFSYEWEEAIRYPEFKEMGKKGWIDIANKGYVTTYSKISDELGNVDLDFDGLEEPKKQRFIDAFKKGTIEMSIAVKFSDTDYDLVAGNTRLAGLVRNEVDPKIWIVDISHLQENYADDKAGLIQQFRQEVGPKQCSIYDKRDNCGPAALDFISWAKSKGIKDLKRINGYFKADIPVSSKNDFTREMKQEFLNDGGDWNNAKERFKWISNSKYAEQWKHIPHYWVEDSNGKIYDPTGQQQFIDAGYAKDLNPDRYVLTDIGENYADGKVKGKSRPGRVKRSGASCKGSVSSLRAKAKKYGGEKGKMYHWCANMKGGKKK